MDLEKMERLLEEMVADGRMYINGERPDPEGCFRFTTSLKKEKLAGKLAAGEFIIVACRPLPTKWVQRGAHTTRRCYKLRRRQVFENRKNGSYAWPSLLAADVDPLG